VARFLRRATGRPDEVDDLVQQVFVAVFQGLGAWRGEGRFTSWLFGIASRVALEHARAAARRTRREDGWSATLPANHDAGTDPCGAAGARAALRVVEAALSGMGFTTRTVWLMHEVEGLAAPEIARALGSTGVAVRVRLLRARRKVHEALAASGMGRPEVFDAS
jgi:RNA polymerase sigma-70 factor (ECF subfamily)